MRFMTKEEKAAFSAELKWKRAQDVVAERETQRRRRRRAALELRSLELRQERPAAAALKMALWLDLAAGDPERRAALQQLHEAGARFESLRGVGYSAATHALNGSPASCRTCTRAFGGLASPASTSRTTSTPLAAW